MLSDWRLLPLAPRGPRLPNLLVKSVFGTSNYTIYLTDLTRIWSESLDRRQIIRKAFDGDTSIDPSEGSDQLTKLLQLIHHALQGAENTRLQLSNKNDTSQLLLKITASLPVPLSPLIWPICLDPASPDLLTSELILPCLTHLSHANLQVSSLLTYLKDKDHVISRLTDKLRSAGIDLASVFPTVPVPKLGTKEKHWDAIAKSVKGFRDFNEEQWRRNMNAPVDSHLDIEDLIRSVFGVDRSWGTLTCRGAIDGGKWWEKLSEPGLIKATESSTSTSLNPGPRVDHNGDSEGSASESEFQTQNKPDVKADAKKLIGSLQEATQRQPHGVGYPDVPNEPTTDEFDDDLDATPAKIPTPDQSMPMQDVQPLDTLNFKPANDITTSMPKKLGILGGKKTAPGLPTNQICRTTPDKTTVVVSPGTPPVTMVEPSHHAAAKSPIKLGRIGGKRSEAKTTKSDRIDIGECNRVLSGSKTVDTITEESDPVKRGYAPSVAHRNRTGRHPLETSESPSPVRETSQDRGDRKRAELKRQLEEKSKLQRKKKRKF